MAVFFAGLVVLMAVLVIRAPWFGFFAFSGYLYVYALPPSRWRMLGVLAVAAIAATSQDGGLPQPGLTALALYGLIVAVNMALACGITWFTWVREEQNNQRVQALAELAETNRKLEATLAENAGLHEQLLAQAREAGGLDERQRLAREIHDTLAQGLTGIITQLEALQQPGRPTADRRHHLAAALRLARDSLTEARRSVDALRPEPLESARLPEALAEVTRRWSELSRVPAQITVTGTARPLRPELEAAVLRTAQEALANVARHAAASRAGLTLSYMGDEVALDVRDDGAGFQLTRPAGAGRAAAAGQPRAGGFGLTAMRQRAEALAGTFEIESEPGAGTAISARFPAVPEGAA
jgi:signal transduction histidine kinase